MAKCHCEYGVASECTPISQLFMQSHPSVKCNTIFLSQICIALDAVLLNTSRVHSD